MSMTEDPVVEPAGFLGHAFSSGMTTSVGSTPMAIPRSAPGVSNARYRPQTMMFRLTRCRRETHGLMIVDLP